MSLQILHTMPQFNTAELSYMWAAWLKMDTGYIETISAKEVIRNERQHKDFDVYHGLLKNSFEGMHKALNLALLDSYVSQSHVSSTQCNNSRRNVCGFELEKIHHQPLARGSGKSLLQPFGICPRDFYLRFQQTTIGSISHRSTEELMRSVLKRSLLILQSNCWRKEPNNSIHNCYQFYRSCLGKQGYFSNLHTGLDVKWC